MDQCDMGMLTPYTYFPSSVCLFSWEIRRHSGWIYFKEALRQSWILGIIGGVQRWLGLGIHGMTPSRGVKERKKRKRTGKIGSSELLGNKPQYYGNIAWASQLHPLPLTKKKSAMLGGKICGEMSLAREMLNWRRVAKGSWCLQIFPSLRKLASPSSRRTSSPKQHQSTKPPFGQNLSSPD